MKPMPKRIECQCCLLRLLGRLLRSVSIQCSTVRKRTKIHAMRKKRRLEVSSPIYYKRHPVSMLSSAVGLTKRSTFTVNVVLNYTTVLSISSSDNSLYNQHRQILSLKLELLPTPNNFIMYALFIYWLLLRSFIKAEWLLFCWRRRPPPSRPRYAQATYLGDIVFSKSIRTAVVVASRTRVFVPRRFFASFCV